MDSEDLKHVSGPFLSHNEEWRQGFEAGTLYMLMAQRCPMFGGVFASVNEEQLFLLGHFFGYDFEWKALSPTQTMITFSLKEGEPDGREVGPSR